MPPVEAVDADVLAVVDVEDALSAAAARRLLMLMLDPLTMLTALPQPQVSLFYQLLLKKDIHNLYQCSYSIIRNIHELLSWET